MKTVKAEAQPALHQDGCDIDRRMVTDLVRRPRRFIEWNHRDREGESNDDGFGILNEN